MPDTDPDSVAAVQRMAPPPVGEVVEVVDDEVVTEEEGTDCVVEVELPGEEQAHKARAETIPARTTGKPPAGCAVRERSPGEDVVRS